LLAAGDWDDALDVGLAAIDVGERHAFDRVVVRTWFALLPIAVARDRRDLVARAFANFDARRGREPDSPYARVVATAAHLRFAAAGLETFPLPDLESRLPSFRLAHGGPSWLTSVETLVDAWLAAGRDGDAERALDEMRRRLERMQPTRLAQGTEANLRARLAASRRDVDGAAREARRALALTQAPWWRHRALATLVAVTAATPADREEAGAIASRLGIA
jgi:hypothetical protein